VLDAVVHDVIDPLNELLELCKPCVHAVQEAVDVHAGPRQDDHPWLDLAVQILEVRSDDGLAHGRHQREHSLVLLEREGEFIQVALELVLLEEHHARAFRYVDAHALQKLGFAGQTPFRQ
jgi:hypothetical protein